MQFYIKNDSGEYTEANDQQIESLFEERSAKIVSKKLAIAKEKELERIRPELEDRIRDELSDRLRTELKEEISGEYQTKLDDLAKAKNELDVKLRAKTIAAEYGFEAKMEEFLGTGSDDEMRAKADILKTGLKTAKAPEGAYPGKESVAPPSESGFVRLTNPNE